jgi:hypothetical protein
VGAAGTRTIVLLIALAALALPALLLHIACVGNSCEQVEARVSDAPFCSLEESLRNRIVAGYREGRSPDVMAVARDRRVFGATGQPSPAWPSAGVPPTRVPIAFMGAGVDADARIPSGTRLDTIAPTIAEILGMERSHPEVRSGRAIEDVASGTGSRLVVLIAMKGLTSDAIEANARHLDLLDDLAAEGPATGAGDPGSLPLDPAAVLTTIGTGGLPRQHGITGRLLRNDDGDTVTAWGSEAPVSVIATLSDDLDESTGGRAKIGLVGTDGTDLGLVGGNWYVDVDRDDHFYDGDAYRQARAAERLLSDDYGNDRVTDLLAVALSGDAFAADRAASRIVRAAERAAPGGATIVVTATGIEAEGPHAEHDTDIVADVNKRLSVDVVEGTALGGFFVDQRILAREGITEDQVVGAIRSYEGAAGGRVFADVFPAISVSFARYC